MASQRQSGGYGAILMEMAIQTMNIRTSVMESANWAWEIDSKGDVWMAPENGPIRRYRVQDWIAMGVRFIPAQLREISMPAEFAQIERIKYFPDTDVMYIAAIRLIAQKWHGMGIVGTEIVRYDNWSTNKNVRWRVALPYAPAAKPTTRVKAMDVAGDKVLPLISQQRRCPFTMPRRICNEVSPWSRGEE